MGLSNYFCSLKIMEGRYKERWSLYTLGYKYLQSKMSVPSKRSWLFHFKSVVVCYLCLWNWMNVQYVVTMNKFPELFLTYLLPPVADWERPHWHSGTWPQPHHRKHRGVPWRTVHMCSHQLCWRRQERFPCHNSGCVDWILHIIPQKCQYRKVSASEIRKASQLMSTWSFLTSSSSLSQSDK